MQDTTSSKSQEKISSSWSKNKVGAFWMKKKDDGKMYLSGTLEIKDLKGVTQKIPVCIFKNEYSDGRTPHFQAFKLNEE